jgi:hypothetical protein
MSGYVAVLIYCRDHHQFQVVHNDAEFESKILKANVKENKTQQRVHYVEHQHKSTDQYCSKHSNRLNSLPDKCKVLYK